MPRDKGVVLGLVSSKVPALEPVDLLRRRIDEASRSIDIDRLGMLAGRLGPRLRQIRVVSDLGGHARCVAVQSQNVLMPH